jgi:hypothetical protein
MLIILKVLLILSIKKNVISPVLSFTDRDNIFLNLLLIDCFVSLFLGNAEIDSLSINKLLLILFKF